MNPARLIFVDETGRIVDGDAVMLLCARQLQREGRLRSNAVVATVMSNIGLELALRDAGIGMVRCSVGDKYVMEEMIRRNIALGGEQSGHVIFRDRSTTGDGLLTGIELVLAVRAAGVPVSELVARIPRLPQVVINSRVRRLEDWREDAEFVAAVERATLLMGDRGRILVRPSGTEPKIRIMVEGDDATEIDRIARELATLAEARLN